MDMLPREFNDILRKGKQVEDFEACYKTYMVEGRTKVEAIELARAKWLPIILCIKHGVDINGSGGRSMHIDMDALAKDINVQRDVMWVYTYINFNDVCAYGNEPSSVNQPVAPSPGAYNMWRLYHFAHKGIDDFMKNVLPRFAPSKAELDKSNAMLDDGRTLINLNDRIMKNKEDALKLAHDRANQYAKAN